MLMKVLTGLSEDILRALAKVLPDGITSSIPLTEQEGEESVCSKLKMC